VTKDLDFTKKPYEQLTKEVITILTSVRENIKDESDLTWVYYKTVDEMRNELDKYITAFEGGNLEYLDEVNIHFAPTAAYQEHSMSNNWTSEYHNLAAKFDEIYEALKNYR